MLARMGKISNNLKCIPSTKPQTELFNPPLSFCDFSIFEKEIWKVGATNGLSIETRIHSFKPMSYSLPGYKSLCKHCIRQFFDYSIPHSYKALISKTNLATPFYRCKLFLILPSTTSSIWDLSHMFFQLIAHFSSLIWPHFTFLYIEPILFFLLTKVSSPPSNSHQGRKCYGLANVQRILLRYSQNVRSTHHIQSTHIVIAPSNILSYSGLLTLVLLRTP